MRKKGIGIKSNGQGNLYFYIKNTTVNKELKTASRRKGKKSLGIPLNASKILPAKLFIM